MLGPIASKPIKYPPISPSPAPLPPKAGAIQKDREFAVDDVRWTFNAIDSFAASHSSSHQSGKISKEDIKGFLQDLDCGCTCYTLAQKQKLKAIAKFLLEKFDNIDQQYNKDCYLDLSEILCAAQNDGNDCFLGDPDFSAPCDPKPPGHQPTGFPIKLPVEGAGSGDVNPGVPLGDGGATTPSKPEHILDGFGDQGHDYRGNPISDGAPPGSTHRINHLKDVTSVKGTVVKADLVSIGPLLQA